GGDPGDDPALLAPGDQVVHQYPEPAPRPGTERPDRLPQPVDAVQRLDDHALDPQVVAPDPLDQGGVVDALHPDPAGPRDPRLCADRDRPGGRAPAAVAPGGG